MPELVNLEDFVPPPRPPMTPSWLSNLKNRPSHGDELAKKIAKKNVTENKVDAVSKKTCICSPTNHAGLFRCSLHRTTPQQLYQCRKEYGGNDREVTSVKPELPKFKFGNNNVPQLSRFGRASVAGKN